MFRNIFTIIGFSLVFAFALFGCIPDIDLPHPPPDYSSSTEDTSSSSVPPQSEITYGPSVLYEGETYQTVVIGTQTWFKRNLNYNASGSKCCDNLESNCATYGRLYNWATANTVCPDGWHLPSNADWDKLYRYVDGGTGTSSPYAYASPTAGTKLKAVKHTLLKLLWE